MNHSLSMKAGDKRGRLLFASSCLTFSVMWGVYRISPTRRHFLTPRVAFSGVKTVYGLVATLYTPPPPPVLALIKKIVDIFACLDTFMQYLEYCMIVLALIGLSIANR